jgi:hypothetical protein
MKMMKVLTVMIVFAAITAMVGCAANPYANRSQIKSAAASAAALTQNGQVIVNMLNDSNAIIYAILDSSGGMTTQQLQSKYGMNFAAMFDTSPTKNLAKITTVGTFLVLVIMNQTQTALFISLQDSANAQLITSAALIGVPSGITLAANQSFTNMTVGDQWGNATLVGNYSGTNMVVGITTDVGNFAGGLPMNLVTADATGTTATAQVSGVTNPR